jgi:hypothetical protein
MANSKKIALLISGHLRSILYTIDNIIEIKKSCGCDIYLHTWDEINSKDKFWGEQEEYQESFKDIFEFCCKRLNPKAYKVENQYLFFGKIVRLSEGFHKFEGYRSMLYGIYQCSLLAKEIEESEQFSYDVFCRYRYDICCHDIHKFTNDLNSLMAGDLLTVQHNWATPFNITSDIVFAAEKAYYLKFVNEINLYFEKWVIDLNNLCEIIPEQIIYDYSINNKFKLKWFNSSYSNIKRNGSIDQTLVANPSFLMKIKKYVVCLRYILKINNIYTKKYYINKIKF